MADTAAASAPASPTALPSDAVLVRIEKLERKVKHLRRKVRQMDKEEIACVVLTQEMEAELDRRVAEIEANPGQGMTLDEYKSKIKLKYPGL